MSKQTTERAQNKHLRPNPEKLGVKVLTEGESTQVVRVRGTDSAVDWFKGLTSEERGALVQRLFEEAQAQAT